MSKDQFPKVRRTSREMYPLVEQWGSSGLSQKDFCLLHDLPVGTFHYWVQKYRSDSVPATSCFVAIVSPEAVSDHKVSLIHGEIRLEFDAGVAASFLAEVVEQLTARC